MAEKDDGSRCILSARNRGDNRPEELRLPYQRLISWRNGRSARALRHRPCNRVRCFKPQDIPILWAPLCCPHTGRDWDHLAPLKSPFWFCRAHCYPFTSRLQSQQNNLLAEQPHKLLSPRIPAPVSLITGQAPSSSLGSPAIMVSGVTPSSVSFWLNPMKQNLPFINITLLAEVGRPELSFLLHCLLLSSLSHPVPRWNVLYKKAREP